MTIHLVTNLSSKTMKAIEFKYNDGGRSKYYAAEGVKDCVTRAIAIATARDYKEVYDLISGVLGYSPRNGIKTRHVHKVMALFGGVWVPRMQIGSGCKCHLRANEIPMTGRIVCNVSKHVCAVVDGVLNDTHDCSRRGERCVYGYWVFDSKK